MALAHVVVAGNESHRQPYRFMHAPSFLEIALLDGAVEGDIAGVQDEVGRGRDERRGHPLEVCDEERLVPAQVRIGYLCNAVDHGLIA